MASPYTTTPLRTCNALRLLELSPGRQDDPNIRVTIRHTNLAAAESSFEAISYTWGAQNSRRAIYCGSGQLDVSLNCYTALLYLRHPSETRTLWMDAICINQTDIAERNAQVRIMGKIYRAASRVIVFLGEHDPDSYALFQHFAHVKVWLYSGKNPDTIPRAESSIAYSLGKLFDRSWFTRVWVIQELWNARDILFMCGKDSTSYEVLVSCLFGYKTCTRIIGIFPAPIEIFRIHRKDVQDDRLTVFEEICLLIVRTGQCQASDPRDRILALMPLLQWNPPSLENLVDYSKSAESIFEDFSCLLLEDVGLFIFSLFRRPHSREMPTWILDFSQHINFENYRYKTLMSNFISAKNSMLHKYFSVSEGQLSTKGPRSRLLTVHGVRYGRIDKLSPVIEFPAEKWQTHETLVKDLFACINSMRLGTSREDWPESIVQAVQNCEENDLHDLMTGGGIIVTTSKDYDDEIIAQIVSLCNNSRIFVTSDGRLGLATREAMSGDMVCLIRGAFMPWILRENVVGDWNMICGDCLLHERDTWKTHLQEIISNQGTLEEFFIC